MRISIEIDKNISIVGGSYNAITMAKSSLIQIIKYKDNNTLLLPKAKISDKPDSSYRGLMIDLSRMWHDLESIRNVIDMASLYKIKYCSFIYLTIKPLFFLPIPFLTSNP